MTETTIGTVAMGDNAEAREIIADWIAEGVEDLPDDTPVRVHIGNRSIVCDTLGVLRTAALSSRPAQEAVAVNRQDGNRPLPFDREQLGRFVREAWVRWAETQPNPKPSWIAPYDQLSETDKEADRQIGEAVARWTLIGDAASMSNVENPSLATLREAISDILEAWDFWQVDPHDREPPRDAIRNARIALYAAPQPVEAVAVKPLERLSIRVGCPAGLGSHNAYAYTEADDDGDYVTYEDAKRAIAAATPSHGADTSATDTAPNVMVDIRQVIDLITDSGKDALPDSEYRLACNDLVEALEEFASSPAPNTLPPATAEAQGVEAIVTDVLTKHCGQQGGSPRVNWYALRNELVAALATPEQSKESQ